MSQHPIKIAIENLNLWYDKKQILHNINMNIYAKQITAFIGSSGCGKSTLLRTFNRMNDLIDSSRVEGRVVIDGKNIYDKDVDEVAVRKRVGMVFQQPNPFPKSIYDNIAYAAKVHGIVKKGKACDDLVEACLKKVFLWDEVKDMLKTQATSLSGGQQQRLCIARAIAIAPDTILMDEPTSALDPISGRHIEELIVQLKNYFNIIIVTHNLNQAQRIADYVAYFDNGHLVEYGTKVQLFEYAQESKTEKYIEGKE